MNSTDMLALDKEFVWHPYSSSISPTPIFAVESAQGAEITLADGRVLVDGMASWWSVLHGYNHPDLNAAAQAQMQKMSHMMFGGLTHEPAVQLCKTLVEITPANLDKVFISDSGSVAAEIAIKMAFQYWISQGQSQKNKLLTVRNGYHGDTFATMAVCDPVTGMHHMFEQVLAKHYFADAPPMGFDKPFVEADISSLKDQLEAHHNHIAAVIIEPIVQGTGGMRFYSPDYLKRLRELCDQYDVLLICDEIATGFGRTGKLFACEFAGISPDILCLGKAITGGFMSLAATLCSNKIADGISSGEAGVFMHGPTFMGNPLACSVANASIKLLLEQDWQANVKRINTGLETGLAAAKTMPQVADVRTLGAIGVIELKEPVDMKTVQPMFVEQGIWVRPFGKLIYVLPPLVISDEQLAFLTKGMIAVVEKL